MRCRYFKVIFDCSGNDYWSSFCQLYHLYITYPVRCWKKNFIENGSKDVYSSPDGVTWNVNGTQAIAMPAGALLANVVSVTILIIETTVQRR